MTDRFDLPLENVKPTLLVWFPLLAAIVVSIGFFDRLPETVPVHWSTPSQPDKEGSRLILAALFPALQFIHVLTGRAALRRNRSDSYVRSRLLFGIILLIVQGMWFQTQSGSPATETFFVTAFIGVLLAIAGFFMSEAKQNIFFGVRTSWTLNDARVWQQTHQLAGPLTMVTGGICFVFALLLSPMAALGATVALVLVSAGLQIYYSYLVAKQFRT